jgi:hypothetical protein
MARSGEIPAPVARRSPVPGHAALSPSRAKRSPLIARLRRAGVLLQRRWLLAAGGDVSWVTPRGRARPGRPGGVLVLQSGDNASVDYFIRPRLESPDNDLPWNVVDLDTDPQDVDLLARDGLLVIVCRYITGPWLRALERNEGRFNGVVLFIDDDLPEMVRDRSIPSATRGRILRDHGRHTVRLGAVASAVWVTSRVLAGTLSAPPGRVLEPLPSEAPAIPTQGPSALVVYHGGPTHGREQAFVLEIAAALTSRRPDIRFEISGGADLRRRASRLDQVEVVPIAPWRTYRAAQSERRAAIMLAPLFDTAVNRARAPVKFFDAARLGAVGLYAAGPVYDGFVREGVDGRLLPMQVMAWVEAIEALIDAPDERMTMAMAAHARVSAAFADRPPLLPPDAPA